MLRESDNQTASNGVASFRIAAREAKRGHLTNALKGRRLAGFEEEFFGPTVASGRKRSVDFDTQWEQSNTVVEP